MAKGIKIPYSEEERKWIKDNIKGKFYKDLTEEFCKRFNRTDIDRRAMNAYCLRNGLDNGMPKHYEKGNVPINKGKKQKDYMSQEAIDSSKRTRFKKGNIPLSFKQIGHERIDRDGYIMIKIANPGKWVLKHRYIWEQVNGKIPKDKILMFIDGNTKNTNIDNLALVSRQENLVINRNRLLSDDPELNKAAIKVAKIKVKIYDKEKERKQNNNEKNLSKDKRTC